MDAVRLFGELSVPPRLKGVYAPGMVMNDFITSMKPFSNMLRIFATD